MGMRGMPQLPQPDHRRSNQMSVARPFNDLSMSPFGGMDSFSSFNNIFSDMHNLMSRSMSSVSDNFSKKNECLLYVSNCITNKNINISQLSNFFCQWNFILTIPKVTVFIHEIQTFMDPSNMMDMNKDNAFGYSSMKVQSYVDDGSGKPKTYEAHKSTKYAPGGVSPTYSLSTISG